jgi:hypothetical protein
MEGGFVMTFLDDSTLLFGEPSAVKLGLDTRDGEILNLDTNATMAEMMTSVDSAPFWSILDQLGTQNMMRSALGDAAKIADYETVKKRCWAPTTPWLFQRRELRSDGCDFGFDDARARCRSLMKAAIMYKKSSASPIEKAAMDKATSIPTGEVYGALQGQRRAVSIADALAELFAAMSH